MAGHRHQARLAAVQCLMGLTVRSLSQGEKKDSFVSFVKNEFLPTKKENDFFYALIDGTLENRGEIDQKISELAPEWPVEKLSPIDRVILELGMYELIKTDTPTPIVINEAIEIAKYFADEGAPKFINGVLSNFSKILARQ